VLLTAAYRTLVPYAGGSFKFDKRRQLASARTTKRFPSPRCAIRSKGAVKLGVAKLSVIFFDMRLRITKSTWAEIRTAYASGIGLREIARNMNIPEGTVLARAKRESWTQQIQSARALTKREDSTLTVRPLEAVAMSMQKRGERHVERMAGVSERGVDHIETMDGLEILNSVDQIERLDKVARRTFGLKDDNPYSHFTLNTLNINTLDVKFSDDNEDVIDP
jgi:hypothetical protein